MKLYEGVIEVDELDKEFFDAMTEPNFVVMYFNQDKKENEPTYIKEIYNNVDIAIARQLKTNGAMFKTTILGGMTPIDGRLYETK